jgi:hypothetical protein
VSIKVKRRRHNAVRPLRSLLAGLTVCLLPALAIADDAGVQITPGSQQAGQNPPLVIRSLQNEPSASGLAFDLGGSETRKLELQLSEPLTLNLANNLQNRLPVSARFFWIAPWIST